MKIDGILLIDDDSIINLVNRKFIESEFPGYPIMVFENGLTATQYIKENSELAYLVFLDINMPIMNGWEFLIDIKKNAQQYNLKIHILTSSYDLEDKQKAQENKLVSSFITKPLNKEKLKDLMYDLNL